MNEPDRDSPDTHSDTTSNRGQHVLHLLPPARGSIRQWLPALLDRADDGRTSTQIVVLVPDAESASAVAELSGELRPSLSAAAITGIARGRRFLQARKDGNAPALIAATPTDLVALMKEALLKLDAVRAVAVAGADEILAANGETELEAVMAEMPRAAMRVVITGRMSPEIEAIVERYARHARRPTPSAAANAGFAIRYLATAESARPAALRRLLDDVDPERAVVIAQHPDSFEDVRRTLRSLGYADDDSSVRISDGPVPPRTALAVLYDPPLTAEALSRVAEASPAQAVALIEPRQLAALREAAGGAVTPFTLSGATARLRRRDERLRDELRAVLTAGAPPREILSLEPLLSEYDGAELAAAALVLLERERARALQAAPPAPRPERTTEDRFGDRPARGERPDRDDRRPRGDRFERGARGDRPGRSAPRGRPDRDRDARGPRDRFSRGPSDRGERGDRERRPPRPGGPRGAAGSRGGGRPPRDRDDRDRGRQARGPSEGGDRNEWSDRGEQLRRARRVPGRSRTDEE